MKIYESKRAFTLVELLTVIFIIAILAALVLQTAGYVQKKAARSRASAEIAALSTALESYRADYGAYPASEKKLIPDSDPPEYEDGPTDILNPDIHINPNEKMPKEDPNDPQEKDKYYYQEAGAVLYNALLNGSKIYFDLTNQAMVESGTSGHFFVDPFGMSYGYSTKGVKSPSGFFDLWSTAGLSAKRKNADGSTESLSDLQKAWITNW